jgi:hypothetical protein
MPLTKPQREVLLAIAEPNQHLIRSEFRCPYSYYLESPEANSKSVASVVAHKLFDLGMIHLGDYRGFSTRYIILSEAGKKEVEYITGESPRPRSRKPTVSAKKGTA